MRVAYDISVLGTPSRAGVFRTVETLAQRLTRLGDVDLSFCVTESSGCYRGAVSYLRNVEWAEGYGVSPCRLNSVRGITTRLRTRLEKLGNEREVDLLSRSWRTVLRRSLSQIEPLYRYYGAPSSSLSGILHSPFFGLPSEPRGHVKLKRFLTVYDLIPILFSELFCCGTTLS
jgi:hypothetical protein